MVEQKIKEKTERIEKLRGRIATDRENIRRLEKEISELETQRVLSLVNELNIPFEELKSAIKQIKNGQRPQAM